MILSNTRYEATATSLDPGDEFTIDPNSPSPPGGSGLILLDDTDGMTINFRAAGQKGHVTRSGGTGFDIDIPAFQQIKFDSALQSLWAVFIFITGLHLLRPTTGEKK
jgi:hypothetical protein